MTAATGYPIGAIKHDPATGSVAVRTVSGDDSELAWGVMTVDRGGHYASSEQVAEWDDVDVG